MFRIPNIPLLAVFTCAALKLTSAAEETARVTADSFQSLLQQALEAYTHQNFTTAHAHFQQLENDFGSEPEYRDPNFRRRMLPIQGQTELAAGFPTAAALTLGEFVENHPNDQQHPDALLALATALRRDNRPGDALSRLTEFTQTYPDRPEIALARMQQVEIHLALNQTTEALALLNDIIHGDAPAPLRDHARLQAARRLLNREDRLELAAQLLLDHPWDFSTFPEITALSFSALDLGDRLMEAELFTDAIRAYRLVPPWARLLERQTRQTERLRNTLYPESPDRPEGFALRFQSHLLKNLTAQTRALEETEDYTPSLLLRRGQAYLVGERHHEAWLLFERLALDETLPATTREEANFRWILAATGLELWEEALTLARNFLARYPEAPLAPQAIYLIAQAHQEQRRYAEASDILTVLLTRFPEHPLAQRWRFTLGFNQTLLEFFPEARVHFRQAVEDYPETPLTANAELWHALAFFFQRDYPAALTAFDRLAKEYHNHPLEGEILYRRAATLYAMRDYPRAETAAANFVEQFHGHPRHGEALVLLGDIRMGAGELDAARTAFQLIDPEAGPLFLHGLFQQGKILRAQQDFTGMIALFSDYAESREAEEKPRLSEALYWIGWALTQLDRTDEALPLFQSALQHHGNDPASPEIGSILQLLEQLYPLPGNPDLSFGLWIETESQQAVADGKLTYFSRLNLHLANASRQKGLLPQADNFLFEIANLVPIEDLGPDALGEVGHMMAENDLQAAHDYFLTLLKQFPDAPERAFAYHGLGQRSHAKGDYEQALVWLRRFQNETATHPLAADALQLTGKTLLALKQLPAAEAAFEEILGLRSMRGRPHAAALIGLAEVAVAAENPKKAIACYQRVYTMHRAQIDLTAKAYYESSRLFEELGDTPAAHRTLTEMLSLNELAESPYFKQAREREAQLAPRVATTEPSPERNSP